MTIRVIDGMRELAPRYDGFILDLWGVVHDGVAPFPGVLDCMERLLGAGKRLVLLSNAPRRADDVVRRIAGIGVPDTLFHGVMSSGEEAWRYLSRRDEPFYAALGRHCLHIGSDRDLEIREGLDLTFVTTPAEADFILNTGPAEWDDTIEDYAPIFAAARERDLPMVCANPDLVVVHGGKPALCAGALAEHYEAIGGRVRWHGKPYPSVYDSCLTLLGIADRRRILAIGDSLRTDIAGAVAAGIDSLLVASGIHLAEFTTEGRLDPARVATAVASLKTAPIAVTAGFAW
ncbi:MAG TPA: TIGR01459 family HAD-type hydrolase [Stellaceae bacterium]|jgi:HAD superfamily hydrolase (TIGR01459 family)|nr:TIGR01459 family HAD-type hydrolase [Stellaceae bacterium]